MHLVMNRKKAIPEHLSPRRGELIMFENPLLERLSRISPRTVLAVFIPYCLLAFYLGLRVGTDLKTVAWLFLAGILFWTFFEYVLHRFVFHFYPDWKFQQRLQYTMHGVHHQYPADKDRLVMPVTVSIPLSLLLLGCFYLLLGNRVWPFFSGFMLGYLIYDMIHYSVHFFTRIKHPLFLKLRQHHMDHHFRDPQKGYGVSSPFWDRIFRT
jgi:sterol desaturase/sphingolipid hydroxylase (fatty acid hydroxylase superfamily)